MKKTPKTYPQLNPYSGGLDDDAFLRKLGIDPDGVRSLAEALEIPFTADDIDPEKQDD